MLKFLRKKTVRLPIILLITFYVWGFTFVPKAHATLTTDMRAWWPSTNGTIPANWSEDIDYSNRFLQGSDDNAGVDGGSLTFQPTCDAETPTSTAHDHIFSADSYAGTSSTVKNSLTATIGAMATHNVSGLSPAATASWNAATTTLIADTVYPPWFRMILIKPNDAFQEIPDDAVVLTDTASLPTGFEKTDGGGTRPSLDDKFLLTAVNAGDGGGTGGSLTHTPIANPHLHTKITHQHPEAWIGTGNTIFLTTGGAAVVVAGSAHHQVLASAGGNDTDNFTVIVNEASSEPAWIKLLGIQNTSGSAALENNIILPYVGTVASIPAGFELYDTVKQIKVTVDDGEIETTGGANEVTHTTVPHTHTVAAHSNHGFRPANYASGQTFIVQTTAPTGSGLDLTPGFPYSNHVATDHANWACEAITSTVSEETTTVQAEDVRYLYRTVIFVKKISEDTFIPSVLFVNLLGGGIRRC